MFISEAEGSKVFLAETLDIAFKVSIGKKRSATEKKIVPSKFVEVKGWKPEDIDAKQNYHGVY